MYCNLPEIHFLVTTGGITIMSNRFTTDRFLAFDKRGRCEACKSDSVEIDYIVRKEGVTIYSPRMKKEKFIPFDVIERVDEHCFFRIKVNNKSFNVPYSVEPNHSSTPQPTLVNPDTAGTGPGVEVTETYLQTQ